MIHCDRIREGDSLAMAMLNNKQWVRLVKVSIPFIWLKRWENCSTRTDWTDMYMKMNLL